MSFTMNKPIAFVILLCFSELLENGCWKVAAMDVCVFPEKPALRVASINESRAQKLIK